jgi:pyruvate/2-oxoglutarate dehydrogenase complex dihydrolipoamide acyltransferase (E2) component
MTPQEPDRRKDEGSPEEERMPDAPDLDEAKDLAPDDDTDVVLDVPVLNVEELDLEVDELRAHISARAELAGFLNISVGVDAYVDNVKLNIKGVEAQVQLKVKLERILGSIDSALRAIDNNPQLLDPDFRRSKRDADEEGPRREITAEEPPDPARDGEGPAATNAARKRARELGVDISGIEGTGSGGRVLVRDVLEAAGS